MSRLFHAPSELRNQIVEARFCQFFFAAFANLRRRVRSRQLNSSELNVTPMLDDAAATLSRSSGAESRQQGIVNTLQNPLYSIHSGGERQPARRVQFVHFVHVQGQECTTTVYHLGHPITHLDETRITIYSFTEYNQSHSLRATPKSMEYQITIPQVLPL